MVRWRELSLISTNDLERLQDTPIVIRRRMEQETHSKTNSRYIYVIRSSESATGSVYEKINTSADMNADISNEKASFDALFITPHFIGLAHWKTESRGS